MIRIIQLETFSSIYNTSLQENLCKDNYFINHYNLIRLNLEEMKRDFEVKKRVLRYENNNLLLKFLYLVRFNHYCLDQYKYLNDSIINIQFVSFQYIFLLPFLKKYFSKIVLTVWGSDLLRIRNIESLLLKPLYNNCDVITVETEDIKKLLLEKFGKKIEKKITYARFGLSILDHIAQVTEKDINNFINKYNIDINKRIVVIGYNRIRQQNHIKVIQSIIDNNISKKEIFIIVPWTYGITDSNYRDEIEYLLKNRYDYIFLDDFLLNEETACLRKITDILIQVQTTDSLSGTMLETLYAGKTVITGKWLPYDEIIRKGIFMYTVNNIEDCGKQLFYALNHPISHTRKIINQQIIYNYSSWRTNISNWINAFQYQKR